MYVKPTISIKRSGFFYIATVKTSQGVYRTHYLHPVTEGEVYQNFTSTQTRQNFQLVSVFN